VNPALRRRFCPGHLRDVLQHGLVTAVLCVLIALGLTFSGVGSLASQLVYSLSIGLIAWLVIDLGRLTISQDDQPWPHGGRGLVLVAAGIAAGFVGGNLIGDAFAGRPMLDFLDFAPRKRTSTLVITVAAGVAICYFYYSRGKARYLEGQIALAQRDATEARLKLLETQLEPHMLFNTLANLRALIAADPPRAVAMLDHLDRYLRVTLAGSRALSHPLAAEFARLADYLELMSVRMGPRLRYVLDLPEALRETPVPPLLLQPLVENAIRHGLEPQVAGGEIRVRAHRDGPMLAIELSDTGAGVDGAAPADNAGFGLAQVRERLASQYGARATLVLQAVPGGGTCATLRLPV